MEGTVEDMDLPYLTIAEASEKTGRSQSTIRRVIRSIADTQSHPDRSGIEPAVNVVKDFKKKGENFTWKICEDVLLKNLSRVRNEEKNKQSFSASRHHGEIFDILRSELDLKNQQIEKQWEVIQSLNERLREGNILMGTLQKRLALPEVAPSDSVLDAQTVKPSKEASRSPSKKTSAAASTTSSTKASVKPSKKGVFGWLFR